GVGQDCLRHCVSWFATVCIPFTLLIDSSHHSTTCFIGLQECVGSSTMTIRQVTAPQSGASKDFSRQYGVDCLLPVATCSFVYRLWYVSERFTMRGFPPGRRPWFRTASGRSTTRWIQHTLARLLVCPMTASSW